MKGISRMFRGGKRVLQEVLKIFLKAFTEASTECTVAAMDTPLLTIADAVEKTGRSPSTVRRLIRTITDAAAHPDREGIEPAPAEVDAFKKKAENFTWKIREDVLLKHFKGAPKEEKKSAPASAEPQGDIFQILERELEIKNRQIEKQWEVIHSLNDRLREGNILMGSLQKRLTLPSGDSLNASAMDASAVSHATEATQKPSMEASAVSGGQASGKPSKKGLLGWLRR